MRKFLFCVICGLLITASAFAVEPADTIYGPTTATDNLWRIAIKLRPNNDTSVQQVMLALLEYNKDAFYCNNVNALEPGKTIELPATDKVNSISKDKAYQIVEQQNRQWNKTKVKASIDKHKHKKLGKKRLHKKAKKAALKTLKLGQAAKPIQPVSAPIPPPAAPPPVLVPASAPDPKFIADTNNRLTAVEAKVEAIQTQVSQVSGRINCIEQGLEQLKKQDQDRKDRIVHWLKMLGMGSVFVFSLLLSLLIVYMQRHKKAKADCFDHMELQESITAKLNLARAYVDMGKENEAQAMLHEVLLVGSHSEQAEAKTLLEKIKKL